MDRFVIQINFFYFGQQRIIENGIQTGKFLFDVIYPAIYSLDVQKKIINQVEDQIQPQNHQVVHGEQPSGVGLNQLSNNPQVNDNEDCLNKLSLPQKIAINVIIFVIVSACFTLGIIYGLKNRTENRTSYLNLPARVSSGQLSPNIGPIIINSIQLQQEQHIGIGYGTNHQKLEMVDFMTASVLSQSFSSVGQVQYTEHISFQNFLANFNFTQQRTNTIERLKEYFRTSPETALKKLINETKINLEYSYSFARDGTKIVDNLKLVKIDQILQIELFYDITEQKLKTVPKSQVNSNKWEIGFSDLSSQSSTNLKSQSTSSSDSQFDNLFLRVMRNPIWEMKQTASRSIDFLNSEQSQELIRYQQTMADTVDNTEQSKQTLISDCRTIQSLKFRCNTKSVHKILPQLTEDNILTSRDQFLLSHTLKLVFETTKQS